MSTRAFYNSRSEAFRLGRRVGTGGEGSVYEIQGKADLVAKIYHQPPSVEKTEKLVALAGLGYERLFNLSAWPVDVLRDKAFGMEGRVVGFVMKKIGEAEEVHTLHSPRSRLQKFPEASWAFLIHVAANISRAISVMHEHGYVVGDVNPKNILVTRKATVYLLDCDSFQITADGKTYRCVAGFPEYTPPELQGVTFKDVDRNQEHDCFGLAVVIFQLLFLGRHPFSGKFLGPGELTLEQAIQKRRYAYGPDANTRQMQQPPGTLPLAAIPASMNELFRQAFLTADRPPARDWIEPLESLARSLKRCDLHSGHHYFDAVAACPWCEIETRARIRLFNFTPTRADQNRGHFRLDDIWREIERVAPPLVSPTMTQLTQRLSLPPVQPSPEAKAALKKNGGAFDLALFFSAVAGFVLGLFNSSCLSFVLLFPAAIIARKIVQRDFSKPQPQYSLLSGQPAVTNDPLVLQFELHKRKADDDFRKAEERWEREAGEMRFRQGLEKLKLQKEDYENLARIRQAKLKEVETKARLARLDEHLGQIPITDAPSNLIGPETRSRLSTYGIKTAADLTKTKLEQIRTFDQHGAKRLNDWRKWKSRQLAFDPIRDVPAEARATVERQVDDLRVRLESELSSGAYYLRRLHQEILDNRRKLEPEMAKAYLERARAEKDHETITRGLPTWPTKVVLVVAFILGQFIGSAVRDKPQDPPPQPATAQTQPQQAKTGPREDTSLYKVDEAMKFYREGMELKRAGKLRLAEKSFRSCTQVAPTFSSCFAELGYVAYKLGHHEESLKASGRLLSLEKSFDAYYYIALVYAAQGNWLNAKNNLDAAIWNIEDIVHPEDKHLEAYSLFGQSLLKLGTIETAIQEWQGALGTNPDSELARFQLGNLYSWVGKTRAAREQYQELKRRNSPLAEPLNKLIARRK